MDYHDNEWGRPVHDEIKLFEMLILEGMQACTQLSDRISKDLKKMGFKFVGSTIIYSFMQAIGMVNDHLTECFVYKELTGTKKKTH